MQSETTNLIQKNINVVPGDDRFVEVGELEVSDKKKNGESNIERNTGILGGFLNLANSMVGGGILAFPYAFYSTGVLSGLGLVLVFVCLAGFSLHILFYAAIKAEGANLTSYQEAIKYYCGKYVMRFCEAVIFIYNTGACLVYLTIIGDSITPVVHVFVNTFGSDLLTDGSVFFFNRQFLILFFGGAVVFPLLMIRNTDKLKFSSGLAMCAVLYIVLMITITGFFTIVINGVPEGVNLEKLLLNRAEFGDVIPEFFMAVPCLAFAFNCHVISIPIYREFKNPTILRFDIVILMTTVLVCSGYTLTGIFGFLMFGKDTDPDILKSFADETVLLFVLALIARVSMAFVAMFSYPILYYGAQLTLKTLFCPNSEKMGTYPYISFTTIHFLVVLIASMFLDDISNVMGFVASICGVLLAFGFPSFIFTSLIIRSVRSGKQTKWFYFMMIIPVIYWIVSISMIVIGPLTTVFKILEGIGVISRAIVDY